MDLEACYTLFDALQLIKNTSMCVICLEMVQDPVFTRCQHMFCRVCITRILNSSTKVAHCPLCNTLLTKRNLVKNEHISKQIECAHRLIDSITEDLPMELSYFERPPHSTKEALTPVPYSGNTRVCNTTMNNSTNIEYDKNKLDYSSDDLVNNIPSEIMSCNFNRDKTNLPDKLTATKTSTLCTTGTPRFGKSYVRKPSLNSAGKLPGSDKSSSLSVDAESVRTLDLNLPTVNKSNSIANWLSSQTNSVCRVVVNKIDNLYPGVNISDSTSLNSVKTDTINENNNLSSSLTKNKCISTLKHFERDKSNFAMKLVEEPNKRETIYDSLLQKSTVPKGIFDVESKNDSQIHNTFKSKHQSDKCNDYQSDGINGDKEDPFIFISSQRTPRRVRYRKDGVKIVGKTRALRPDKEAIKQKEADSNTIPRVIADEAQNVNVDFVENCPVDINDSFDQMVQDYKSRGNTQKQDAEISESGDESDDCLNYLFKSLEGNSSSHAIDNPPRREEKDKTKTNSKLRKKRLMNRSDTIALSKNKSLENVMMKEMEQSFSEINKHKLREENKLPLIVTTVNHRGNDHSSAENTRVAGVSPKTDHAQVGINSKCDSFIENKIETLTNPKGKNVLSNYLNKRYHNTIGSCSTALELVTLNKDSKLHNVDKSHLYQKSILGRTPLLTDSCDGMEMPPKHSPNILNCSSSKPENSKQDQILSETSGPKYDILPTNPSVIEVMESPAKKQKLDIFDKITQEIQSRLSKNLKLVSKKEDSGAKNNPNKEITLETPIVGSGAPVELKLKSNITDTVESIPYKTLECKNHRNDSKSVFSFDGSGSDKFPRRVIIPTSDESDGQSSLSDTRHASLTSIKENTSTATQNKPLIKFWYLSSLRCRDKDDKFLSCSSHLVCNECSPLRHRNSHSFPCSPKETCDEECQATVAKLDVGTQSESHLTSKAKRTPIYVETGVQTCVPNKSCGNVDKLDPTSPTCSEIDPANLTRTTTTTTTTKNPQETSTKSTCCENTKLLTFASIEKQIQNNNVKNTIVESTDIEFVPETEDNHCTDSEIFSESLAEVMSEDRPNDGKPLSKCSSLHLKPPVGLQRKQNGTSTLPNDSSNGTRIINRSSVNVFAGENKSNIHVNFEDMPTQKQSSNANNKYLSSLSDVSTVLLSTGEVNKYIKEPEIYSKKKKVKTNVLESGSHLTHNKQMPGKSNCENKVIIDYEVNNTAHSKANKAKAVRHLTFSQNVIPKLTDPSSSIFTEENTTPGKTKSKKVTKRARRISTSSDSGGEIRHEARKRKLPKENIPVENETLSPRYKNDHYFENDILSFDSDAMDEDEFMRRAVENCEVSNSLSILPPDAPKNNSSSTGATDGCDVKLSTQDGPRQSGRRNNQLLPNVSLTSSLQALLEPESRIDAESTQPHTMEFLEGSQKDDAEVCRTVEHDVHTNSDQDISSLGPESYLLDTQQQHDMEVKNKILKATIKECEANLKARMNVDECHMVADSNESEQELNADSEESQTEDFIYPTPQGKSYSRDIKTRLNLDSRCKQSPTPSKQSSNTTSILNTLNPQQTADVPTSSRKRATTIDYRPMAGNVKQSTNPRLANIRTPSLPTELCVACSGLTLQDKQKVVHFADFFKLSFSNSYESRITHLVVPKVVENLRTIKFLFGIAEKKWIVYLDWVTDSIAANTLLPEERYEALGNDVGPRLSRQTNTPLFQQFEFYFDSLSSGTIDKAQIENLVTICGATVVSHPIKFNLYSGKICMIIIETQDDDLLTRAIELYNEFKAPSFYLDFIIESIAQFAIADCYDYVTLPITKEDFRKFGYPV